MQTLSNPLDSQGDGKQQIFLLDAPFLTWDDISDVSTPNINSILEYAGVANLVARSISRIDKQIVTPEESASSLAAGWWCPEPSSTDTRSLQGRLGQALSDAGWQTAAIGNSDYEEQEVRPAFIAVADEGGHVEYEAYNPDDILSQNEEAAGKAETNYEALLNHIQKAIDSTQRNQALAIDTGDLYRAGAARIDGIVDNADEQWSWALSSFDEVVGEILSLMDGDDALIIYSSLAETTNSDHSDDAMGPLIVLAKDMDGLLFSPVTIRAGTVTILDLTDTICGLAGISEIADNGGALYPAKNSNDEDVATTISELDRVSSYSRAIDLSLETATYTFIAVLSVSFAFSIVMLSRAIRLPVRVLSVLISITRLLWILTMSYPLATYLMYPLAADGITPNGSLSLCLVLTVVIALVATLVGRFTRWLYSLLFLMAATIIVLLVDQLAGGILAQAGYLSYRPIEAVRFSGIGNEGAGVLFGSWLLFSGLILNRFPDLKASKTFAKYLFPIASFLIIAVIVAPWWGANFGVLVWGTVGVGCAWWMFIGRRLNWRAVTLTVIACGLLTLLLIIVDGTLGDGQSHLGATATNLLDQGIAYVPVIIRSMLSLSVETLLLNPVLSVVLVIVWIYLAWLRIRKPGPYAVFWERNTAFKASFTAAMIVAVLMLLIEDSGILLPAIVLLYAAAGLTWLICDLHKWELRAAKKDLGLTNDNVETPIGGFKVE